MGSQRVGHNWATELKWTELTSYAWLYQNEDFCSTKNTKVKGSRWETEKETMFIVAKMSTVGKD